MLFLFQSMSSFHLCQYIGRNKVLEREHVTAVIEFREFVNSAIVGCDRHRLLIPFENIDEMIDKWSNEFVNFIKRYVPNQVERIVIIGLQKAFNFHNFKKSENAFEVDHEVLKHGLSEIDDRFNKEFEDLDDLFFDKNADGSQLTTDPSFEPIPESEIERLKKEKFEIEKFRQTPYQSFDDNESKFVRRSGFVNFISVASFFKVFSENIMLNAKKADQRIEIIDSPFCLAASSRVIFKDLDMNLLIISYNCDSIVEFEGFKNAIWFSIGRRKFNDINRTWENTGVQDDIIARRLFWIMTRSRMLKSLRQRFNLNLCPYNIITLNMNFFRKVYNIPRHAPLNSLNLYKAFEENILNKITVDYIKQTVINQLNNLIPLENFEYKIITEPVYKTPEEYRQHVIDNELWKKSQLTGFDIYPTPDTKEMYEGKTIKILRNGEKIEIPNYYEIVQEF